MYRDTWFRVGLIGSIVAAVCCFTPLAVVALGALGLGAYVGWLDVILLPALLVCVVILVMAIIRSKRAH